LTGHLPELDRETLAVVIPTKNAAHLLKDCLDSVAWVEEMIVVDMFSDDDTVSVCEKYPQCRIFSRDDYIFANVNFGFRQATTDWIMRLDSDERLTPELAQEIRSFLLDPPNDVAGLEFWERPIELGKEMRFGFGHRHYRKMMFRNGTASYAVRHEHEDLQSYGNWQRLSHGYLHYNYSDVSQYLHKMDYYTTKDVNRAELPLRAPHPARGAVDGLRSFYLNYLKRQGFRDGWVGFVDAAMRAVYYLVYSSKLRERWEQEQHSKPSFNG
jgi:glycosyltransferase involved in cell wall biosynthesis